MNGSDEKETFVKAEKAAEKGGFYRPEGKNEEVNSNVASTTGTFFSGTGKAVGGKKKTKIKLTKLSASSAIVFGILILGIVVLVIGSPMLMIGAIDYNLQKTLGFTETTAILERQAEYVTAEMLSEGEVPNGYADDLANNGLTVGQITAKGDFIRTNVYIANIEKMGEVAAIGNYQVDVADGELAILYNNKIIKASEFVAAVESDPKMYADYSEALDISARYYYSKDVSEVYSDMGISRNAFMDWEGTGDSEKDSESFYEILGKILDEDASVTVNGVDDGEDSSFSVLVSGGDANSVVNSVTSETKAATSSSATKKAAQLLNSAISSNEPYRAAKAFMAIEEPINRARAGDNGPVNEVMNSLNESTSVSYTDVNSGETVTENRSILETRNFAAAVSGGDFSKEEANNFSRDRVLNVTSSADSSEINGTTVATNGNKKSNVVLKTAIIGSAADSNIMNKASSSVSIAFAQTNSELFQSVVGGNRIVEGGSFLSNKINQRVLGAAPSDVGAISAYHNEVKKVLARKAEAERVTLSPFDISSPNTFLGNIMHNFAMMLLKNTGNIKKGSVISTAGAVVGLAENSVKKLTGVVSAEGGEEDFTTIIGDCATVSAANVEGDIYCTSHNTIDTDFMHYTKSDWGDIASETGYEEYTLLGMSRETTVGVMSSEVCEAWKNKYGSDGLWNKITNAVSNALGLYQSCGGIDRNIATGAKYALSNENTANVANVKRYSGYTLYDTVYSLLSEKKSESSLIRENYYAEHPRDDSAAGRLARISGMEKSEAEAALSYASYLDYIARYDASDRFAFGDLKIEVKKSFFDSQDEKTKENLYGIWSKRSEYRDERNRNYTV